MTKLIIMQAHKKQEVRCQIPVRHDRACRTLSCMFQGEACEAHQTCKYCALNAFDPQFLDGM